MIDIKECFICEATEHEEVFKGPYFRGDHQLFSVKRCKNCGFWFTSPRPQAGPELTKYYETEDYVSHTEQSKTLTDKLYMLVRKWALTNKLAIINREQKNKGALLDYGAGTGAFLEVAQKDGWITTGVEPSNLARQQAERKNVSLFSPDNPKSFAKNNHYSAITLWHVLEHLPDLNQSLQNFHNWLKPGGTLVIAVPNHESFDAKKYKENWAALDLPLHLYHFSKSDIRALAQKHYFEVRRIKNMPFDAFYVSMLSQGILKKPSLLRAFWIGLKSNWQGLQNQNMSSLIYVLKKP